ncbi:hypothetical protein K457DRAFT_1867970 [Linnemannia elongata AG-77]|uniref:F-box domain-containing protein n=1 Tax=Linnemannia elongata AG-77 TaxID=1314771 RepID=A0A197JFQ2_9FUNG|nr:hypothetical protein K457DRAFT_1867970 [Linnemannia elongata AG-77]
MTRFFELPELVAHVAHHLDHKSISRLMRTSRQLHSFCTPALYYNVYADYRPRRKNLFASKESIDAFARNVDLVRDLDMDLMDMVYYVNCVFVYQDQPSALPLPLVDGVFTGAHEAQQEERMRLSRRPRWLAPPDPQIRTLFPIPPMTLLTKLDLHLGFPTPSSSSDPCPYSLPSSKDSRATLTQTCWLLDSNPHLLDLRLTRLTIRYRRDIRLLSRAVFGLKRLQEAKFELLRWNEDGAERDLWATRGLALAMFFACSPALRKFHYEVMVDTDFRGEEARDEYLSMGQEQPMSWEMTEDNDDDEDGDEGDGDESRDELAVPRLRKEPVVHLTSLHLWNFEEQYLSETEFRSMLEHCPNLTTILVPPIHSIQHPQQLAQEIAQQLCPKLTNIEKAPYSDASNALVFRILEALPAQQAQRCLFPSWSFLVPGLTSDDIGSMFRRQSATLREIELMGCRNIDSKAIRTILVECWGLGRLQVQFGPLEGTNHQQRQPPLCINLDDAIEYPWGCTRIQDLHLTIAIPDEPLHRSKEMGLVPYYDRPPPTTLSPAETAQFQSLEALYRQIGALIGLERLTLKAVYYGLAGLRPADTNFEWNSFPGMLNLKNEETGRPGYLQLLGGLTKLNTLFGKKAAVVLNENNQ